MNNGPLDHNLCKQAVAITDAYMFNQSLLLLHFQPLSTFQSNSEDLSFVNWLATKDWINYNHTSSPTSDLLT
ncbi:hypothetical protein RclHR1_06460005 [Rhizophagus clarus]|nr:hypothetical protein RclHR1_06460005 [Rhizophagus clarus]